MAASWHRIGVEEPARRGKWHDRRINRVAARREAHQTSSDGGEMLRAGGSIRQSAMP